jgi:hypothetical protein
MDLLTARKSAGFDRFDVAILALYTGILAWAIPHHRLWADEAQAWLIARDSSLHDLLFRRLHYEGAPALWHIFLWIVTRLHLPYASINWFSGAFAATGIFLLLRYSPFPRLFRWLLPFTFFLQYQYAVIARPYALFPMLLFAMCIVFTLDQPRPILFAILTGLMANISLHGAIIAGCFWLLYMKDTLRLRGRFPSLVPTRSIVSATAVFLLMSVCSIGVAFPAPDESSSVNPQPSRGPLHAILLKLVSEEQRPSTAIPLDPPLDVLVPMSNQASAVGGERPPPRFLVRAGTRLFWIAAAACYPIARSNLLAVGFLLCCGLWLWSRHALRLAIPWVAVIVLATGIWVYDQHTGMFLLSLVAAVWIALATAGQSRGSRWIEPAFATVAGVVMVLQVGWTIHCMRAEAASPYDPGRATAEFLASNYPGKHVAGFAYESVSAQPYTPHKLFFNQEHAYWVWSNNVMIDRRRSEALAQHPDVVVVGSFTQRDQVFFNQLFRVLPDNVNNYAPMLQFWKDHGYRVTQVFCGDRFMRGGVSNTFCEEIMEPVTSSAAAH